MFEHIGKAGNRDYGAFCVAQPLHRWDQPLDGTMAHCVERAIAKAEPTTWLAYLAQHSGEGNQRPERHLAPNGALQRPCGGQHGAALGDLVGEFCELL